MKAIAERGRYGSLPNFFGLNIHTEENRVGWMLENRKDIECPTS